MKRYLAAVAVLAVSCLLVLLGCTPAQQTTALSSQPGQLFCAIQTGGGGALVVGLVNAGVAAVPGAGPAATPLAIIATGATKAFVDGACAAAAGVGKTGIPVSPPANPAAVPQVAVVPPTV